MFKAGKIQMVKFRPRYIKDYFWRSKFRNLIAWIVEIIVVIALAFGCAYFFGQQISVSDDSMQTTLAAGEKVLLNTAKITFSEPKRGDIIAFKVGNDENAAVSIKRVIGVPGDEIQIKEGQIFINGDVFVEERDFPAINSPGLAEEIIKVDGAEFFVLGDSRNNSEDSRHVEIGNVPKDRIVGVVWMRVNPFGLVK